MNAILEAKNLTKVYQMGKDIKQTRAKRCEPVHSAGRVHFGWPSGSGKSTLLHSVSGMDRATFGNVRFCGTDFSSMQGDQLAQIRLRKMGFIYQQSNLLINRPEILFGDEPTGALNSKSAEEIMDILAEINRIGTTVLIATNDAKVAARTERVLFMCDGKIVSELQLSKWNGKAAESRIKKSRQKYRRQGYRGNLQPWLIPTLAGRSCTPRR